MLNFGIRSAPYLFELAEFEWGMKWTAVSLFIKKSIVYNKLSVAQGS